MEASLRSRIGVPAALGVGAALLYLGACRDEAAARPATEVVESILQRCLGDRRDAFEQLAIEFRAAEDGDPTTILIDPSGRIRVSDPASGTRVLARERAFAWVGGDDSRELTPDELQEVVDLRELARAVMFEPLRTASGITRIDHATISLGNGWDLRYEGTTPLALTSRRLGELRFARIGEPPALGLPRLVEIPGIGTRHVRILGDRVQLDDETFLPPEEQNRTQTPIVIGGPDYPTEPVFQKIEPCKWLLVEDPGTWEERLQAIREHGMDLHRGEQRSAGEPFLLHEGDRRYLVICFQPQGDVAYEPNERQSVRDADVRTAAVVYAPKGTFKERVEAGAAMINEFLTSNRRKPGGPMRIVVDIYNECQRGLAEGSKIEQTMDIRLEQPISK